MKITRILGYACVATAILTFTACQKDNTPEPDPAEKEEFIAASSESHAESEAAFNDVFDNVIGVNAEVGIGGTGIFGGSSPANGSDLVNGPTGVDSSLRCFIVTVANIQQGSVFPVKVEIDFGLGCTGRDGKVRKGKMITVYSNRLILPGATATTTFEDYYINGVKVEGTHIITNKSTATIPSFEVKVNGKLLKSNGNYSEWISERTVVQVEGANTILVPGDDVFQISGSASGNVKKGDRIYQWSTELTSPLIKKFSCRWIVKGVLSFKKGNFIVGSLDYGNGECDNKAALSVNGSTRIITLH